MNRLLVLALLVSSSAIAVHAQGCMPWYDPFLGRQTCIPQVFTGPVSIGTTVFNATTGIKGPVIACVGAPGNTAGPYGSLCEVRASGALWACTNAAGCTISGDWAAASGAGTVSSVGLAGTANQITVTGSSPITGSGSWTLSLATAALRRASCMVVGANNATAVIADADLGPQTRQFFVPAAATVVEVTVSADGGTPNIIVGRDRTGTGVVNLTSAALATASTGGVACSNAAGTTGINGVTTCSNTLQNTSLSAGDWLYLVSGTAGGVAKEMTACVSYTLN